MATTIKPLVPAKFAENSQTTQYTAATGVRAIIDKCTVTNTTAASATISVNIVPASGSVADSNLIIDTRAIAAGECYTCPELVGQYIEPSGFISTLAGTASALTIRISGREVT